jgi:hypothetical protein
LRTLRLSGVISKTNASLYLTEKTAKVVIVVLAVPTLLAVTVGTAGIAPVGVIVTAGVCYGLKQAFGKFRHMLDVKSVLAALADYERAPESYKPNVSTKEIENTLLMARNMVNKLISDMTKLNKKEIPRYLEELKKNGVTQLPSQSDLIKEVLRQGKLAAGNSNAQNSALLLLPINTKSSDAPNAISLVHLRLQRILGYMRWLHLLVEELKAQTQKELSDAQSLEPTLIARIERQVHAGGNHATCESNLCFGPESDLSFEDTELNDRSTQSTILELVPNTYKNLAAMGFNAVKAEIDRKKDDSMVDKLIQGIEKKGGSYIDDAADEWTESISDSASEVGADMASDLLSDFGSDVLKLALGQAKQTFLVNRPLLARVKQVQEAIHGSSPADVPFAVHWTKQLITIHKE